jgi:hypothetical protein
MKFEFPFVRQNDIAFRTATESDFEPSATEIKFRRLYRLQLAISQPLNNNAMKVVKKQKLEEVLLNYFHTWLIIIFSHLSIL